MNNDIYFDQKRLLQLNSMLCENIEDIFDTLDIEYTKTHKMIICACPIHGGDNESAFNLYTEELENGLIGNWKCRTHHCEDKHGNNILALLRGLLDLPWRGVVDFACELIGVSYGNMSGVSSDDLEKRKFTANIKSLTGLRKTEESGINKSVIRNKLQIPCQYYIDRGYSADILDRYDVGLCTDKSKRMYRRAVVPVYDNEYRFAVGFTGRATFDDYKYKWIHNSGFLANNYLYNYWFAKKHVMETGCIILVEGPGDVWRLEENGIHISVAIFGTDLSDQQMSLLYGSGANSIVVLTDNDDAGKRAAKKISEKCGRLFRMFFPKLSQSDVGDLASDDITADIKPILEHARTLV